MVLRTGAFACLGLVFLAMACDWLTRRIPNVLTLGGVLAGLALHSAVGYVDHGVSGALRGFSFSLIGAAICIAIPVIQFARGEMGGGDVKLFAAIGALAGPAVGFDAEAITFAIALLILWPYRLVRAGWRGKTVKVAPVIMGPAIFAGMILSILRHGALA